MIDIESQKTLTVTAYGLVEKSLEWLSMGGQGASQEYFEHCLRRAELYQRLADTMFKLENPPGLVELREESAPDPSFFTEEQIGALRSAVLSIRAGDSQLAVDNIISLIPMAFASFAKAQNLQEQLDRIIEGRKKDVPKAVHVLENGMSRGDHTWTSPVAGSGWYELTSRMPVHQEYVEAMSFSGLIIQCKIVQDQDGLDPELMSEHGAFIDGFVVWIYREPAPKGFRPLYWRPYSLNEKELHPQLFGTS